MSPTVFWKGGLRYYFFSREEPRPHVHVHGRDGEAKFRIEPRIELARHHGFSLADLTLIRKVIEEHEYEIREAWNRHFR